MSLHPILNYYTTKADELFVCPYNQSHQVLHPRLSQHLMKCRKAHLAECRRKRCPPAIEVCRWNSNHHFGAADLKGHEAQCPDRESALGQLISYSQTPAQDSGMSGPAPPPTPINMPKPEPEPEMDIKDTTTGGFGPIKDPEAIEEDWEPELKKLEAKYTVEVPPVGRPKPGDPKKMNTTTVPKEVKFLPPVYNPLPRIWKEGKVHNPQGLTKSERKDYQLLKRQFYEEVQREEEIKMFGPPPVPGTSGFFAPRNCNPLEYISGIYKEEAEAQEDQDPDQDEEKGSGSSAGASVKKEEKDGGRVTVKKEEKDGGQVLVKKEEKDGRHVHPKKEKKEEKEWSDDDQ